MTNQSDAERENRLLWRQKRSDALFVALWYSDKVTYLDDFVRLADQDDEIDFVAQPWTVKGVNKGYTNAPPSPTTEDCVKVRTKILSLVVDGNRRDRADPNYIPRLGLKYAVFTSRTKHGKNHKDEAKRGQPAPPMWHVRRLKLKYVDMFSSKEFSFDDFKAIIGKDFEPHWGGNKE